MHVCLHGWDGWMDGCVCVCVCKGIPCSKFVPHITSNKMYTKIAKSTSVVRLDAHFLTRSVIFDNQKKASVTKCFRQTFVEIFLPLVLFHFLHRCRCRLLLCLTTMVVCVCKHIPMHPIHPTQHNTNILKPLYKLIIRRSLIWLRDYSHFRFFDK